jgi:hypothetical protein
MKKRRGWQVGKSGWPTAGPKPWRTSIGVASNVFRKPKRRGYGKR